MQKTHAGQFRFPSLNALVVFEAAARRGSLTLAAEELHVTAGAASRQVKALEQALGVELFRRRHNAIELTEAGLGFLGHVDKALEQVRTGIQELAASRQRLTIQAPITMTQRWLIPRIENFCQSHPEVDLHIRSIHSMKGDADIDIRYSRDELPEEDRQIFLVDRTIPVCSPRLLTSGTIPASAEEVLKLPILLDTIDGWAWHRWCDAAGTAFRPVGGSIAFDTDEAAIDACLSGLGVAQANAAFVEPMMAQGRLLGLCPNIRATVGSYSAVARRPGRVVTSFIGWLRTQYQST
ncbi:MAG: LysR family transcriptional regulator [Proteobacteria bacterium]|nr:LysR family transcriptional regulator [Pseudomonadota bacterium]